jgi:hypothetical protein
VATAIAIAACLAPFVASARPGGGSSYHGSSHSSGGGGFSGGGGGGGGGGGNILDVIQLVILCVEHPVLGCIVLVVCGLLAVVNQAQTSGRSDWSTSSYRQDAPPPARRTDARSALAGLRRFDDSFSTVVFEDFLYALYAQVHAARGAGKLESFSAYLASPALEALARLGDASSLTEVKTIIVGALHFVRVEASQGASPRFAVTAEFEANYAEVGRDGREHAWYVRERWWLSRDASAPSRPPERARLFACPSCGAPLDGVTAARCKYCGKQVCSGAFDWVVARIEPLAREARGPMLTADTPEEGTDLPTIVAPDARSAYAALAARDTALSWKMIEDRIGHIFLTFQRAWGARDLAAMRPLLSDNLFEVETYWIRAYQAQHLRNVTQSARITRLVLARVATDRFFDSVTVRLFATGLDYTVRDGDDHVVCGSRTKERAYSEYWTLIRSAGRAGPPAADNACPSCGAPLSINMAGHCTYCKAKVTSGEFDWVLSKIEQDESYEG